MSMNAIINVIVEQYRDYKGLDEIKRGLRVAIAVSDVNFTDDEVKVMMNSILYRLNK